MIFLLQRTGQAKNFSALHFLFGCKWYFLQRTGQGKNFFTLNFLFGCKWYFYYRDLARARTSPSYIFCLDVNDIFIAENWSRQELLCPRVFCLDWCKWYFYYRVLGDDFSITLKFLFGFKLYFTCRELSIARTSFS